jgi:hypothetical protein
MGYQPAPQALFAQQATAPSPFILQGDASANPAAFVGANQALVQQVQAELAQQGITLSPEEVMSLMPQEATAAISQELAQNTTDLKAQLEAQLPNRRNWLQTATEVVLPTAVGFGVAVLTAPLGPGAVALGAAAAAATAGVTNVAIQKGALSNKGFDWNRKVDKFELGTSVALSALPLGGIGSGAGKLALNTVGKKVTSEVGKAAIQYGAQGTVRGALIGGGVEFTRQAANGEQINLGRIGASAFTGGVFGGVSGGALGAAGTKYVAMQNAKLSADRQVSLPKYGTFEEASTTVSGGLNATGNAAKGVAMAPVNGARWAYGKVRGGTSTPATPAASGSTSTPATTASTPASGTAPAPAPTTSATTHQQLELDLTSQPASSYFREYNSTGQAIPKTSPTPTPTPTPASTSGTTTATSAVAPPPPAPAKPWWKFWG